MEDYPVSQIDFESRFSTEDSYVEYLTKIRWPDGFQCPKCQSSKYWRYGTILKCASCRKNVRFLAGTLFQKI
ncbi:MAG: transposase [Deltaproteobacteria bacterium]|nr:transposase [Deltaproteobacteria bacterium]